MKEFELLHKYQIKTPRYKLFKKDEKITFNHYPAVLKIYSPLLTHKSDLGAVITNIKSDKELEKAKEKILQNLKDKNIEFNDFFLIQEQINGIEMFIGGVFDEIFEEVLVFGSGGVLVEVLKDVTYIDTNSNYNEIKKAIFNTKISKIFPTFRGKSYNIDIVVKEIQKFQKLFANEDILEFDINPLIYSNDSLYAVDVRMKFKKPQKKEFIKKEFPLFKNESVAIIGASEKEEKVGYAVAKNALNSKAKIYFVNPKLKTLFNKKVYTLNELPNIDTAVVAIPTKYVLDTIKSLINKGTKNFIIISAGFKESGNIEDEIKLKELAKEHKLNIIGPNCLGIYNSKKELNLTFAKSPILKGETALLSQSGAVLTAIMDKAASFNKGFSHIISMGNMADYNFAHAIEELSKSECKTIAIYAEGIQYGKEFLKAIRTSNKEILFYKAGKSEAAKKAAFSHTGNIAGNYEMIITLSQLAGAKIRDSIEGLIFYEKKEVIILTNAGGPGTILTDLISKKASMYKLSEKEIKTLNSVLPPNWSKNNPIDIIGDATSIRYKKALEILSKIDAAIFAIVTPQFMTDSVNIVKTLINFKNVYPILLGKESFKEAIEILENEKRVYFTSLEEAAKIV